MGILVSSFNTCYNLSIGYSEYWAWIEVGTINLCRNTIRELLFLFAFSHQLGLLNVDLSCPSKSKLVLCGSTKCVVIHYGDYSLPKVQTC